MLLLRRREGDFYMGEGRGEQLDCAARLSSSSTSKTGIRSGYPFT